MAEGSTAANAWQKSLALQLVSACCLSIALTSAIWIVDYIPTHDGPNTIVNGYLALHLDDPGKGYAQFLKRSPNVTSLGFGIPFEALLHVMPWRPALRITTTLGALAWAWGFFALLAAVEPRRLGLHAFGFATALSWPFYMGFYSYWIASGLGLLSLAFAVSLDRFGLRRLLVLSIALLAVAIAHSFVGMLVMLVLAVLALTRDSSDGRLKQAFKLGLAMLPALAIVALSSSGSDDPVVRESIRADPFEPTWLAWDELLTMPARCFAGGPYLRSAIAPLLALIGLLTALMRLVRRTAQARERALTIAAALLCVLSLALPFHLRLWSFFSPRFVPFWVMLGIALVPVERISTRLGQAAIALFGIATALGALAWSAKYQLDLTAYEADAIALADAPVKRSGKRLPLTLRPPFTGIDYAQPGVNLPLLYIIAQGGMVPDLFATIAGIHPHLYREPAEKLFPNYPGRYYGEVFRRAGESPQFPPKPVQLTWLARAGASYEDVILLAEPADADAFISHGYIVDQRRGRAAIVHYRACGLELSIESTSARAVPMIVKYGWAPILRGAGERVIAKDPSAASGPIHVSFPEAPCGPVWVQVIWDNDNSRRPSAGDGYCNESGPLKVVDASISRENPRVLCTGPKIDPGK